MAVSSTVLVFLLVWSLAAGMSVAVPAGGVGRGGVRGPVLARVGGCPGVGLDHRDKLICLVEHSDR